MLLAHTLIAVSRTLGWGAAGEQADDRIYPSTCEGWILGKYMHKPGKVRLPVWAQSQAQASEA